MVYGRLCESLDDCLVHVAAGCNLTPALPHPLPCEVASSQHERSGVESVWFRVEGTSHPLGLTDDNPKKQESSSQWRWIRWGWCGCLLSSEYGTYKTVTAILWPKVKVLTTF